jgi:beta-lactamase regulating signal transducer with metallopeptidase domain
VSAEPENGNIVGKHANVFPPPGGGEDKGWQVAADLLIYEVGRRLISSVSASGFWLICSLAVLFMFRIRNPSLRYMFFLLPLTKSLMALIFGRPQVKPFKGAFFVSAWGPNPKGLLRDLPEIENLPGTHDASIPLMLLSAYALLGLSAIFLVWRIIGFIRFQQILREAPEVDRSAYPNDYETLGRLTMEEGTAAPKLICIDSREVPFTIGIGRPLIAVSSIMLDQLAEEEMEAALAHEIAHIARRDHLIHWPVVLLRDVLFFNPFAYWIYDRLSFEKERACDDLGSGTRRRLHLAKTLVKMAELKKSEPSLYAARSFIPQSFIRDGGRSLTKRVTELLGPRPYNPPKIIRRWAVWLILLLLFYFQVHVVIMINGAPLDLV